MLLTRGVLCALLCALTVACERSAPAPPQRPDEPRSEQPDARRAVVFLGTSLTAGLGVPGDEAFPALVQQRIDAAGLPFRVVNGGVSGDTSAGALRRIDWLLRQRLAVLVVELGANDMLRGQDVAALRANLQQIIDRTRAAQPQARIVLAGMQAAPNLGEAYGAAFARTYSELASENDLVLLPFLLEGVAAVAELNQPDGMHPTPAGHRVIAQSVWRVLEPVLRDAAIADQPSSISSPQKPIQ